MLNLGVLSILTKDNGVVLADVAAHETIHEACELVEARGCAYDRFEYNDTDSLKKKLDEYSDRKNIVIAVDGVYSMTSEYARLPEYSEIAKEYGAILYVDDAHGFGILGESPTIDMPYGFRGNGIVNYYNMDYTRDRILYVAGLSKAFSSLGAFITCFDQQMKDRFKFASTYIFSGPVPIASLATALAGLKTNDAEGDEARQKIYNLTKTLVDGVKQLGFTVDNNSYFPIVFVVVGNIQNTVRACRILWEKGLLITPGVFPAVPIHRNGIRFSITSANTEEQVARVLDALQEVKKSTG
jgi:7-keto-8-aminopelargonate synthetase-like enzyme